jgi:hypothetical protein
MLPWPTLMGGICCETSKVARGQIWPWPTPIGTVSAHTRCRGMVCVCRFLYMQATPLGFVGLERGVLLVVQYVMKMRCPKTNTIFIFCSHEQA